MWGAIPKEAIIHTFSVADLLRKAQSAPAIGLILRPDILTDKSSLSKKELEFARQKVPLNTLSVRAIAELARFIGLSEHSPLEHISHIVADVIQGWHLSVVRRAEQEWSDLATTFCNAFVGNARLRLVREQIIRLAFLDGVRFGMGDFNARYKPEAIVTMNKRARNIGLENPTRIITNELDAVRIMAHSHEIRVANLIKRWEGPLLIKGGGEEESEIEEEEDFVTLDEEPIAGPSGPVSWSMTYRIRRADDEEEEDFGRFEYGEDGRVL